MQAGEGVLSPKAGRRLPGKAHEKPPDGRHEEAQASLLERVRPDKVTLTRPEEDRRRRTILIEKAHGSFGFTIQSYGIQYRRDSEVEIITYIDHVEATGPAAKAGMREGDVILSINGQDMEQYDHQELVAFIKQCPDRLRMVVLFEDCVRKVSLHMRYIQLQRQLTDRMYALEQLCEQEKHFIANLRSQGRRIPAFYPAQAGYSGRHPLPQPPHGPPPATPRRSDGVHSPSLATCATTARRRAGRPSCAGPTRAGPSCDTTTSSGAAAANPGTTWPPRRRPDAVVAAPAAAASAAGDPTTVSSCSMAASRRCTERGPRRLNRQRVCWRRDQSLTRAASAVTVCAPSPATRPGGRSVNPNPWRICCWLRAAVRILYAGRRARRSAARV
ncbi:protein TAMALIN-like [Amphibalanus amphitrite]|uniref:protein TAMALIN-like n=1 Tax=Amphibalanus amphitrite TaxID=1232801 RepID=UPI001C91443B|nr:protein TAMALIN-like [Amphibalanus amphitrite]